MCYVSPGLLKICVFLWYVFVLNVGVLFSCCVFVLCFRIVYSCAWCCVLRLSVGVVCLV